MKVYLPIKNGRGGGNLFFKRLAFALRRLRVEVIQNPMAKHDVSVFPVILKKAYPGCQRVLRLDSIYHDITTDYKKRNQPIRVSLQKADAVIYQGKFSKELCDRYLGPTNKKYTLIGNGIDLNYCQKVTPVKKEHKYNFLTASRWRPQKRLVDIMESFLLADIDDSMLYVAGDIFKGTVPMRTLNKYFKESRIKYLGYVPQYQIASYLKIVNGFIHLSWFDCCPNSVVEAIAARVPVLTNNVGGTQELVKPSGGFILPIDKSYDLEPCRLYEPPRIDQSIVAQAIKKCATDPPEISNRHVDIYQIALQYKGFLEGLSDGL